MNMQPNAPLFGDQNTKLTERLAKALEARGDEQLLGMQGIETREIRTLFSASAKPNPIEVAMTLTDTGYVLQCQIAGTVFGAIAEELLRFGYDRIETIGELAQAIGIDIADHATAREQIHLIGCWCIGEVVSARTVAKRLRTLGT